MDALADVVLTLLKLVIVAMLTSLALFIVCWMCQLGTWVALTVAVMTITTGIIVHKLSKGVY